MSDQSNELIVTSFGDVDSARKKLVEMVGGNPGVLDGVKEFAVAVHRADGKLDIFEKNDLGLGAVALGGTTTGALVGLLGGPIGALIGAATGAIIGSLAGKFIDTGIPDAQLNEIASKLTPGTSAIVAITEPSGASAFRTALGGLGGSVMANGIRADIADQVGHARVAQDAVTHAGDHVDHAVERTGDRIENAVDQAGDTVRDARHAAGDIADDALDGADDAARGVGRAADDTATDAKRAAEDAAKAAKRAADDAANAIKNLVK